MSSPIAAPSRRGVNFSLDRTLTSPLYHIASISSYLTPMVVGVVMLVLVHVGRGGEAGGVDDTRGDYRGGGGHPGMAVLAFLPFVCISRHGC
jgi:hypothetical protein